MMKAIQVREFGGPEVLELVETYDISPAAGQILVKLQAAGVNPVETYVRSGNYSPLPELPYTPGRDGAGTVEAVGASVDQWKEGDRVYISRSLTGTYAENALCLPSQVYPLPPTLSFAQGAALGIPYATAYRALFQRGAALDGETILIHGASGGVGIAAVQLAHSAGLRVLGTAGTAEGLDLVKRSGADLTFNHAEPGYLDQIKASVNGHGINLIVEMLADRNLSHDLALLAQNGRVVIVGSRGPVEINPRDLMARNADIRAFLIASASNDDLAGIYVELNKCIQAGKIVPQISYEFPLAQAAQAHKQVIKPGALGKVVLTM